MIVYLIMHGDKQAAKVDSQGHCEILEASFMPCSLYLEEDDDIETRVNNITNFYYWCATRLLPPDRVFAKEILNSIGVSQAVTDRDRARIALSYHCLSITDIFWVKEQSEQVSFAGINLYENHLDNAFILVSLRGRNITAGNAELARDLSTNGSFPKAWIRTEEGFKLLKGGGEEAVDREVLASRVCQCFDCHQVCYQKVIFDGEPVSASMLMTSPEYGIVSREAFDIYALNHGIDVREYIEKMDSHGFYMMNILDYLIGNTDRHWGNWGFLTDNHTNLPVRLHDLMDFNQSFKAYDDLDGAGCLTVFPERMTQKEAAVQAVKRIGFQRIADIEKTWFEGYIKWYDMLCRRMELLEKAAADEKNGGGCDGSTGQ